MGDYICGHCGDMIEYGDQVAVIADGEKMVVTHCEEDRRCSDAYKRGPKQEMVRYEVPLRSVVDIIDPDIDVPTMRTENPVMTELDICCALVETSDKPDNR